ncbi:MAG: hypothetical protein KF878_06705 [Planctomycetes bacterium]|nr:hypothetical protein [Planctomycetota bacterium]
MDQARLAIEVQHPRCPFCRDAVLPGDEKVACSACMGWTHAVCFEETHRRCGACGGGAAAPAASAASGTAPAGEAARPLAERWRRLDSRWRDARQGTPVAPALIAKTVLAVLAVALVIALLALPLETISGVLAGVLVVLALLFAHRRRLTERPSWLRLARRTPRPAAEPATSEGKGKEGAWKKDGGPAGPLPRPLDEEPPPSSSSPGHG